MKYVRISILTKLALFVFILIYLVSLLIIPKNILSLNLFLIFIELLCFSVLFFYVLKNNKIAIKILGGLLIILIGQNIIYSYLYRDKIITFNNTKIYLNFFIILFIILCIYILLNLFFISKTINKGVENIDIKLITEKKQHHSFIFFIIISFISLLIFRFGYYKIEKNIEDKEFFFITKYQNTKIEKNDNLYEYINDFKYEEDKSRMGKEIILDCIYNDKCYGSLDYYKQIIDSLSTSGSVTYKENLITDNKEKLNIKSYLNDYINVLYNFVNNTLTNQIIDNLINNISIKKYYKSNLDEVITFTSFIKFNRELKYKIIYYLNNNDENKAIEILKAQLNTSFTILEGDSNLVDTLVAITCLKMGFENTDLILKNYELNDVSIKLLLSVLDREINKSFLDNSLKNEHKNNLKYIAELPTNTTLYDYEYTKKGFDEISNDRIKNKGEVSPEILNKYNKLNFLKSNIIGQSMWKGDLDFSYTNEYKKLEDLNNYKLSTIEKLKVKLN